MDMKEFEVYESNRMEKNAWAVAEKLQRRLDDAPILGEYIDEAFLTKKSNDGFFFLIGTIWQGIWKLRRQNVKIFQGMLISRRYGISTMLIIIQVSCLWNTRRKTAFIRMQNYAMSAGHMTGWDQARKEYLSQFQFPITLVTI